jgi:hypothetical protein
LDPNKKKFNSNGLSDNLIISYDLSEIIAISYIKMNPVTFLIRLVTKASEFEWSTLNYLNLNTSNEDILISINRKDDDDNEIDINQEMVFEFSSKLWSGNISFFSLGIAEGEIYIRSVYEVDDILLQISRTIEKLSRNIFIF